MDCLKILVALLAVAWVLEEAPCAAQAFAEDQAWGLEVGMGGGGHRDGAFVHTLQDFGYENERNTNFRFSVAAERIVLPNLSVLLQVNGLDSQMFARSSGIGPDDEYQWATWAFGGHLRAFVHTWNGFFRAYLQFGVGPTLTRSALRTRSGTDGSGRSEIVELSASYQLTGLLGMEWMLGEHVGLYLQGGYIYAPSVENLLGDRLQSGGGLALAGVSFRFGRK